MGLWRSRRPGRCGTRVSSSPRRDRRCSRRSRRVGLSRAGWFTYKLSRDAGPDRAARRGPMELPERESMEFDVVVVGAGPAGLAAAIRLKQLTADASVVVVEKGSEVGAHILSGAVIDPSGLDKLLPEWRGDAERPLTTEVSADEFMYLTASGGLRMPQWPMPKLMSNHGNFVGSL